jgi:hypothetical protein
VHLPFQQGVCYKGASAADGNAVSCAQGNATTLQKGASSMEFASGIQGAFT